MTKNHPDIIWISLMTVWLLVLLLIGNALAMFEVDRYLYLLDVGEEITVAWDSSDNAEWYEIKLYHYEHKQEIQLPRMEKITSLEFTFQMPRGGHYEGWIRACKISTPDDVCSEWAKSITLKDKPIVDGVVRIWWLYSYPAAPTGGGVED